MQQEDTDSPPGKKHAAKSCCLLALLVSIAGFFLVLTAIAGIIIVDSISIKGEGYTLERRVERYKVACQFIWVDFKTWVSGRFSESSPSEPEVIQCPADPPESVPEFEHEPESGAEQ